MSDDESSGTSGGVEVTLYECKRCPGLRFTAPERDNHRQQHRLEREQKNKRGQRASSPVRSELTLFNEVVVRDGGQVTPSPKRTGGKTAKRKSAAANKPGPASAKKKKMEKERKKRKSVKNYDQDVNIKERNNGA